MMDEAELALVRNADDVRSSVARFNQEAPSWPYARQLVRSTSYWVWDPVARLFGPSKFVGFAGMDVAVYERAKSRKPDEFDGHVTRQAIESSLESAFRENELLRERLVDWAESLFGTGSLDGIDTAKWKFVALHDAEHHA